MATRLTRIQPALKKRSRALRKAMSEAEKRLWMHLRRGQLKGCRFRRQHPYGFYVLDFVCLEAKLVIEVDGGQHLQQMDRDARRTAWLEQRGFRILRFWNHEVVSEIEAVKAVIEHALHLDAQPPSPPSPSEGEGVKRQRARSSAQTNTEVERLFQKGGDDAAYA